MSGIQNLSILYTSFHHSTKGWDSIKNQIRKSKKTSLFGANKYVFLKIPLWKEDTPKETGFPKQSRVLKYIRVLLNCFLFVAIIFSSLF